MSKRVRYLLAALPLTCFGQTYQADIPITHPAIGYFEGGLDDPVTRLATQVRSGEVKLNYSDNGLGYLPSLLQHLGINVDSQALVFSKTSFQAAMISPRNPRAVYFSDDAAVGFVHGSDKLEAVGLDSRQGVIFYTLETQTPRNAETPAQPTFTRSRVCLQCHQGPATSGVPGIFVSSVYPSSSGFPSAAGAIVTDHRTPFEDRWGGWYVTGTHGEQHHRGNAIAPNPAVPEVLGTDGTQNLTSLFGRFNPAGYLSPVSDIVALMTLEHQTQMTNLITRLGWESRIAEAEGARPSADVEEIVAYMLFVDEVPLKEPVHGVSTFTQTFPQRGPRDRQGRSLRDFDLQTRLFRYPLSYMIYSNAFDALPDVLRERIYRRLYDILIGKEQSPRFAKFTKDDRAAVLEILRDTKPGLPSYWREAKP
jgi:hypothetical protein